VGDKNNRTESYGFF